VVEGGTTAVQLPEIEAGFYLYQDVVLGAWLSVVESMRSGSATEVL